MTPIIIVRWNGTAAPDLTQLRRTAAIERHPFVERTYREWLDGSNRFDQPGEGFFCAHVGGQVVGMCGLNRDPFVDDPAAGRLRHLYVAPSYRRRGIGRGLVECCIGLARHHFTRVRLRTFDRPAMRFYEAMGFEAVAEDAATHSRRLEPRPDGHERDSHGAAP